MYKIGDYVKCVIVVEGKIKASHTDVLEVDGDTILLQNAMKLKFVKNMGVWNLYINIKTGRKILVLDKN